MTPEQHELVIAAAQALVEQLLSAHDHDPRLALIELVQSETVAELLKDRHFGDWKEALNVAAYYAEKKKSESL